MGFSDKTLRIMTDYCLGNKNILDNESELCKEIFHNFMSDNNSSSVREAVTLYHLGYESYDSKHGADGVDPESRREKEVKPRYFANGEKAQLAGNFNDMTIELLEKKRNLDIVCSSFIGNNLIFIVEFPMSVIFEHLKGPILRAKAGKRVVCFFSHTAIQNSDELKVHYYNEVLVNKTNCLTKAVKKLLEKRYVRAISK
jgi:hypothetical protein